MIYFKRGVKMKNLTEIKEMLKSIQSSFNPQKTTYKTIDKLINDNLSANEMIHEISKIKGIEKYPEDLKNKFNDIKQSLKNIEQEELRKKEEEQKQKELEKQEARTKELKDLIDTLEQELNKPKQNKEIEIQKQPEKSIEIETEQEPKQEQKKETKKPIKNDEKEEPEKGKRKFILLLSLVIITLIIMALIFFLY